KETKMTKLVGVAALAAIALSGCVYDPTPGPSVPPRAGGYTLNDNGYQAYYATQYEKPSDCRDNTTDRCADRLEYDDAFCSHAQSNGKGGDGAEPSEPSREISPIPPGGRDSWPWY